MTLSRSRIGSVAIPFGIIALSLAVSGIPSPLYLEYQRQWGIDGSFLTIVYGVYATGVLLALLLMGGVSDRIGRLPVILGGEALLMASLLLFLLADDPSLLIAARALQGVSTGLIAGAAVAVLSDAVSQDTRKASLLSTTATAFGVAVGALGSAALATWSAAPLRIPYLLALVCSIVLTISFLLVSRRTTDSGRTPVFTLRALIRPQPMRVPVRARGVFVAAAITVAAAWGTAGLFLGLSGHLVVAATGAPSVLLTGVLVAVFQTMGGVVQLILRPVSNLAAVRIGGVALFVGLIGIVSALASSSLIVLAVTAAVAGIGFGAGFMGSSRSIAAVTLPEDRAATMASYSFVSYVAICVPVLISGVFIATVGLDAILGIFAGFMAVVALAAVCLALIYPRLYQAPAPALAGVRGSAP